MTNHPAEQEPQEPQISPSVSSEDTTPARAKSKSGLGKGISALLGDDEDEMEPSAGRLAATEGEARRTDGGPARLAIDDLRPGRYQPRKYFNDIELGELSDSIRQHGIMQPLIVRNIDGGYEIIAGERRWRAARLAGLMEVPVIIKELDDQTALELALIENIQREDLNPLEEAEGYQRLLDEFGYTQEQLAQVVGKSRSHVANLLRLLQLPTDVRHMVEDGRLSMGHARALLGCEDPSDMAQIVLEKGLNVRQTEKLAQRKPGDAPATNTPRSGGGGQRGGTSARMREKDPDIVALEETLSQNIGLKVEIFDEGQHGEVVIRYDGLGQLDDILRRLGGVN
jgi:ParB family chromosome partitioning protein